MGTKHVERSAVGNTQHGIIDPREAAESRLRFSYRIDEFWLRELGLVTSLYSIMSYIQNNVVDFKM